MPWSAMHLAWSCWCRKRLPRRIWIFLRAAVKLSLELFLHFSAQFPLSCSNAFPLWSLACLCHAPKYYGSTFAIPYHAIPYHFIPCYTISYQFCLLYQTCAALWNSMYAYWPPLKTLYLSLLYHCRTKKKLHTLRISLKIHQRLNNLVALGW